MPNDSKRDSSDNDSDSNQDPDKEDDDSKKSNNNNNSNSVSDSEIANNTVSMAQPITLKDALKVVPENDGKNKSLSLFLEGCNEAKAMIASVDEENLTKLIRGKLIDEARNSIYRQTFTKIEELIDFIKDIYYNTRKR